jgi:hypothetical protein
MAMGSTFSWDSLYPGSGRPSVQEAVNPSNARGTAKVPGRGDFDLPVLPGLAGYMGISVPMLIALGVLAWYLIERYD